MKKEVEKKQQINRIWMTLLAKIVVRIAFIHNARLWIWCVCAQLARAIDRALHFKVSRCRLKRLKTLFSICAISSAPANKWLTINIVIWPKIKHTQSQRIFKTQTIIYRVVNSCWLHFQFGQSLLICLFLSFSWSATVERVRRMTSIELPLKYSSR